MLGRARPGRISSGSPASEEQGKPVVRAFLSETPIPEGPEFLKHIERSRITANGKALDWTRGEETYRVNLPEPCPGVIDGDCDLGVMNRNGATFRLIYTARVQLGPASAEDAEASDHLRMRIVARPGRAPIVAVTFRGKPAAGAVVKAFPEEGDPVELKTDAQGRLEYLPAAEGRAGLLAKWSEKEPGERDGKAYDEVRYYATLTVAPAEPVGGHRLITGQLPSPPFPRRSTASAAPCSATGCTSTADTPARRTSTAGKPCRSTSGG